MNNPKIVRRYSLREVGSIFGYALAGTLIGGVFAAIFQSWIPWPLPLFGSCIGGFAAGIWWANQPVTALSHYVGIRAWFPFWIRVLIAQATGGEYFSSPIFPPGRTTYPSVLLPKGYLVFSQLFYTVKVPTDVVLEYCKANFHVAWQEVATGTYMWYV